MSKNYFTRFIEWQNYVHYVLLLIFIWILNLFTVAMFIGDGTLSGIKFIAYWLVVIFVADSIVHTIFWYLSKPFQWRD